MPALTGLQHRLHNNLPLACLNHLHLWEVAGWDQGLLFSLMCKSGLWPSLSGHLWQRNLTLILEQSHQSGRKSLGGGASAIFTYCKKEGHGGRHSWCVTVYNFIHITFICCAGWYSSPLLDQWRNYSSNRYVFNKGQGHHLQLRE